MEELRNKLKERDAELMEFVKKHNIRVSSDASALKQGSQEEGSDQQQSGGVLV